MGLALERNPVSCQPPCNAAPFGGGLQLVQVHHNPATLGDQRTAA